MNHIKNTLSFKFRFPSLFPSLFPLTLLFTYIICVESREIDTYGFINKYPSLSCNYTLHNEINSYVNDKFTKCINKSQREEDILLNCFEEVKHIEAELVELDPYGWYNHRKEDIHYINNVLFRLSREYLDNNNLKSGILLPIEYKGQIYYIGYDKFDHMLVEGNNFNRFSKYTGLSPYSFSKLSEYTYFGYLASGIMSYSDLHANHVGINFWQNLNMYYSCERDGCKQILNIKITDYFHPLMDESINLNYAIWNYMDTTENVRLCPDIKVDEDMLYTINSKTVEQCSLL